MMILLTTRSVIVATIPALLIVECPSFECNKTPFLYLFSAHYSMRSPCTNDSTRGAYQVLRTPQFRGPVNLSLQGQ